MMKEICIGATKVCIEEIGQDPEGRRSTRRQREKEAVGRIARELGIEIGHDEDGAPTVDGAYITVSHSMGLAVVALDPFAPIGIDAEDWREALHRVKSKFLSEREMGVCNDEGSLLMAWTAKEAVYKAAPKPKPQMTEIECHPAFATALGITYELISWLEGSTRLTLARLSPKDNIRRWASELGAVKCGVARCEPVREEARRIYSEWIAAGRHGEMQYCEKYAEQRDDPRLLLDGARTIISCAFAYGYPGHDDCIVSEYARGKDYHIVLKERLSELGRCIEEAYGGQTRALVDTAPMRERYWAVRSGLGYVGVNNQLIIPGIGSRVFLGELLWTGEAEPDTPCEDSCRGCMACVKACPGGALDGQGGCDASKCLSYLTIEYRGELPAGISLGACCYGCDICLKVCPEGNLYPEGALPEFSPRLEVTALTPAALQSMGSGAYKRLTAASPMRRVPLPRLKYLASLLQSIT